MSSVERTASISVPVQVKGLIVAFALGVVAACAPERTGHASGARQPPAISELNEGVETLREWFNAHGGTARSLVILSPT